MNHTQTGAGGPDDAARNARSFLLILLPLFVVAHFGHHLVSALVTPLLPFIRDSLDMNYTQAGILVSSLNLAYGLAQLPGGWLAGRMGYLKLMITGISGVALFGLLAGIAPGFWFLAAVLAFMGLIGGGYHPSASPLISSRVPARFQGRALGIHQIGGTGSFFLGPLIAGGIAGALGWRGAFFAVSGPIFLFGGVLYLVLNKWGGEQKPAQKKETELAGAKGAAALLPAILMTVFTQVLIFSALSFVPLYTADSLGASNELSAAMLSIAHSAGLWGGPLGGILSDRFGKAPVIIGGGLLAGPAILLLSQASLQWSIYPILLFLGLVHYLVMPATEFYVISNAPERSRSTMLGLYYTLSRGGPGLAAPLIGWLIDRYSFGTAFNATGAFMIPVALVCSVLMIIQQRRRQREGDNT
jgi:predicted MFS family arabinose efflux permease